MERVIKNFAKQFEYEPIIENAGSLGRKNKFVVGGMGGSHLAADILRSWKPELNLLVHYDYGLPPAYDPAETLFIASSYSGNTEETIDFFEKAVEKNLPVAVIGTGGRLLELAREKNLPYVLFPSDALQPRLALGYSLRALLKIMGDEDGLKETAELANTLKPLEYEQEGRELAREIKNSSVVAVYSSRLNLGLALNWRVKLNETAKMPAYCHAFPELNHNDMASDFKEDFYFIILRDKDDHPKILKRMDALRQLYEQKGLRVKTIEVKGKGPLKFFSSLILADWVSYFLAIEKGVDPMSVPAIEEFKKLIV